FDGTEVFLLAHKSRWIERGSLQGLHRRESRFDEETQLVMKAEAWEAIRVERICAGQDLHACPLHGTHDLGVFTEQLLTPRPIFRGPGFEAKISFWVPRNSNVTRHVLQPRIVGEGRVIKICDAVQNSEGRTLPGLVLFKRDDEFKRWLGECTNNINHEQVKGDVLTKTA